jgi:predicted nucleic acid-binding protein
MLQLSWEEAEELLAKHLGTPILLDEKEARDVAQHEGLLTIGILELAAAKALLNLAESLGALQRTNMRADPSLIQSALRRQAGSEFEFKSSGN